MTLKNNTGFFGVGTTAPSALLSIGPSSQFRVDANGNLIRIKNIPYSFPAAQGTAGTVLTNNGSGTLTWASPNDWSLTGNTGTIDGTNFIGTTDNKPINFRVNNQKAGRISSVGQVFLGYQAGVNNSNTFGARNIGIGYQSLNSNTNGNYNISIGYKALYWNIIGSNNTGIGDQVLFANIGSNNTANGWRALYSNYTGNGNTANGWLALYSNSTGDNNTALGNGADVLSGALTNATAIGYKAKVSTSNSLVLGGTGAEAVKVGIGVTAPAAFLDVLGNIKIKDGTEGAGKILTSDADGLASWATPYDGGWSLNGNIGTVDGTNFIGTTDNTPFNIRVNNQKAGRISETGQVFLGYQAGNSNSAPQNTGIGYQSLYSNTTGNSNTAYGYQALTSNTTGYENVATGEQALYSNTTGANNTANGHWALYQNTTGFGNTGTGEQVLYSNTTGYSNTATGAYSLFENTTGLDNSSNGYGSLNRNTTGSYNSANGSNALYWNTTGSYNTCNGYYVLANNSTGINNTANGASALESNTEGNGNSAIGFEALRTNITGSNNTALGFNADVISGNLTNATAIGYNSNVSTSNSLVLGGTGADAVKVGIGVTAPAAFLDILGNVKIKDGTEGAGKVLTSDADGLATWEFAGGSSAWSLNGNTDAINASYLGTPSGTLVPLNFKVNGMPAGRIDVGLPANTFFGYNSGASITTGSGNSAFGDESLFFNGDGSFNTAFGFHALRINSPSYFANGNGNTAVGANALLGNVSGYNNTALGFGADILMDDLTNATAIGYNAKVSISNSLVLGGTDADAVNVGIGTSSPAEKLEVHNGNLLLSNSATASELRFQEPNTGGTDYTAFIAQEQSGNVTYTLPVDGGTAGQVLSTSGGATPLLSWVPAATGLSEDWKVGGNSTPTSTVIGNDAALGDLDVHAGAMTRILINGTSGNVGIGTTTPTQKLDVAGNIKTDAVYGNGSLLLQGSLPDASFAESGSITLTPTATHLPAGDVEIKGGKTSDYYGSNVGAKITVKGWSYPGTDEGSNIILQIGNAWGYDRYLKINDEFGTTRMTVVNSGNVGIGTIAPSQRLDIDGRARIRNLPVNNDENIVTANADGELSVRPITSLGGSNNWSILGNTGTVDGTNFIGTTDYIALNFRVNNEKAGKIDPNGLVYLGYQAGYTNPGTNNTGIGHQALYSNTAGANTGLGVQALYNSTTGDSNTAVGLRALLTNTTGTNNTAIGTGADVAAGNLYGATAVGSNAVVDASNKVRLGSASVTVVEGQVDYSFPSDARFKENVKDDIMGLDFILKLQPVSYNFNRLSFARFIKEKTGGRESELQRLSQIRSSGFLAQDVEKTIKETGFNAFDAVHAPTNENDNYSLSYAQFVVPLVKAVQEQQKMIEQLMAKVDALQGNSTTDKNKIGELQGQSVVLSDINSAYLGQNIPNPFRDETRIEFYIPEAIFCNNASCRIIFYDQVGRLIQETAIAKSGFGTINVSIKNLSRGVYTYKLVANGEVIDVKKMMLE
ncbi:MAG: tail fiber domain-containing protein [Ignavibacteria bacterium]|nr:tail fiber domain-containing protein [Ignavibacteria bacterium]